MYLVAIGWLYVALMMAVAEANHPSGSLLGAIVTFLFYGLLPTALVLYVLGTPGRRKANREREAQEDAQRRAASASADTGTPLTEPPTAPPDAPPAQPHDVPGTAQGHTPT